MAKDTGPVTFTRYFKPMHQGKPNNPIFHVDGQDGKLLYNAVPGDPDYVAQLPPVVVTAKNPISDVTINWKNISETEYNYLRSRFPDNYTPTAAEHVNQASTYNKWMHSTFNEPTYNARVGGSGPQSNVINQTERTSSPSQGKPSDASTIGAAARAKGSAAAAAAKAKGAAVVDAAEKAMAARRAALPKTVGTAHADKLLGANPSPPPFSQRANYATEAEALAAVKAKPGGDPTQFSVFYDRTHKVWSVQSGRLSAAQSAVNINARIQGSVGATDPNKNR